MISSKPAWLSHDSFPKLMKFHEISIPNLSPNLQRTNAGPTLQSFQPPTCWTWLLKFCFACCFASSIPMSPSPCRPDKMSSSHVVPRFSRNVPATLRGEPVVLPRLRTALCDLLGPREGQGENRQHLVGRRSREISGDRALNMALLKMAIFLEQILDGYKLIPTSLFGINGNICSPAFFFWLQGI